MTTSAISIAGARSSPPTVPAVVVGGSLNGLGIIRSLARARIPVHLIDTSRRCAAAWSRYCRFVHATSLEAPVLLQTLIDLASQFPDRPVLFLTSDDCVSIASAHQDQLATLYRLVLPTAAVCALADKAAFQAYAQQQSLPIPRGLCVDRQTAPELIAELTPPLIIKPADKRLVISGLVERAVRVDTLEEARSIVDSMLRRAPKLIVQEWIQGEDSEIYFTLFSCDRQSRIIGLFPGRKILCSPPAIGSTAICVAAAPDVANDLYRQTYEFVAATNFMGLGSLEFKRDSRTGKFLIIEPTIGRSDWQEEISTLSGVNLPLLTYTAEFVKTEPMIYDRPAPPIAWRASREFNVPADILHSDVRLVDGYFRHADPLPAFYYYAYERLILRIWRRALRTVRPRIHKEFPIGP